MVSGKLSPSIYCIGQRESIKYKNLVSSCISNTVESYLFLKIVGDGWCMPGRKSALPVSVHHLPQFRQILPLRDTRQPLGQMAGTSFSAAEEGHVVPFTGGIMRGTGHCVSLSRVTATFSVSLSESYLALHRCTTGKSALLHALFSLFVS